MASENEASVEEILESIKKVIARDAGDALPAARKNARAEDSEDSALESKDESVLDLAEMELSEVLETEDEEADAPLVNEEARGAMQENLAALAMLAEPGAKPQIVRTGETSLEGLARELMRPMLAEWLDKNLPGMVEEMVQAEIARIAGKRN